MVEHFAIKRGTSELVIGQVTTRILPLDEWPRLDGLLASIWPLAHEAHTEIIVAERDGEIVGSVALLSTLHAECVENRGGIGAGRALYRALCERVKAHGGEAVWASSITDDMYDLLDRHAAPIPGDHFLLRV